jgi:hypothetical protein
MHFISDSKTYSALERVGWNDPQKPFGRTVRQKAGSFQPTPRPTPRPKCTVGQSQVISV